MLRHSIASVCLVAAAPLAAQAAPAASATPQASSVTTARAGAMIGPVVGATVYDPTGAMVGTIDSVTPPNAVVVVGSTKGSLSLSAFAAGPKGPVIALTKAQLEAAMQQAAVPAVSPADQLKTQLVAGAQVKGTAGNVVGTVKAVDTKYVTLTTERGDVRLPVTGFGPGPNGPVIGLTAEQLDAAVAASKPASTK